MHIFQWTMSLTNAELLELKLEIQALCEDVSAQSAALHEDYTGQSVDDSWFRGLHLACEEEERRRFAAGEGHGDPDRSRH